MTRSSAAALIEMLIGEDRWAADINLFASRIAARRYLATTNLRGRILSVPEAADVGRTLFGGLLERLDEIPEGTAVLTAEQVR